MNFGRISEGFVFTPSINLNWYTWKTKKHYYIQCAWLFWYFTTLNLSKFEE